MGSKFKKIFLLVISPTHLDFPRLLLPLYVCGLVLVLRLNGGGAVAHGGGVDQQVVGGGNVNRVHLWGLESEVRNESVLYVQIWDTCDWKNQAIFFCDGDSMTEGGIWGGGERVCSHGLCAAFETYF